MTEQNFVYVDADYIKELEEKGKRHDFFEGYIKGIEVAFAFAEELVKNIKSSDDQQGLACDDDGTLSKAQSHLQKWGE